MSECMMFPKNWEKFIEDYSFKDSEKVYTNGSVLVPVFRVEQMVEHYFAPDNNVGGKWIPVSERLPEVGKNVLMYFKKEGGTIVSGYFAYMEEETPIWNAYTDGGWYTDCECKPTHWMPLPEPPKEV